MTKNAPIYSVYTITNLTSGRQYFGFTKDAVVRWEYHFGYLDTLERHPNKELQSDWKLFGASNFKFEVIQEDLYKDEADAMETSLIRADKSSYNLRKAGKATMTRHGARRSDRKHFEGGCQFYPLLNRAQAQAILARKGTAYGYVIAAEFGVSPSLVSSIFTGKYASNGTSFAD